MNLEERIIIRISKESKDRILKRAKKAKRKLSVYIRTKVENDDNDKHLFI